MKQINLILSAGVLGVAAAHAEIGANETPGEFHLKAGLIHGIGSIAGTGLSAHGEGFRAGVGYQFTDLFSAIPTIPPSRPAYLLRRFTAASRTVSDFPRRSCGVASMTTSGGTPRPS